MKNYQEFVNEGIVPKKKKGTKKTFIPIIIPKSTVVTPPEPEEDLDQIDPNIPIPRVRVH